MGNNTSFGRNREETHGLRDVRRVTENEQARPTNCLNSAIHYSYIGTQTLGQKSSNLRNSTEDLHHGSNVRHQRLVNNEASIQ